MINLMSSKINEIVQLEKCRVFFLFADKWDLNLIKLNFNDIKIKKKKKLDKSHVKLGVKILVSKLRAIGRK